MKPRPLLEKVARSICRASGADPDQPVYRNGNPESDVLYLKWQLYRAEAKAAIEACRVDATIAILKRLTAPYAGPDSEPMEDILRDADALLAKLEGGV